MGNFRSISKDELDSILNKHEMWLIGDPNGSKADLFGAYLYEANLK